MYSERNIPSSRSSRFFDFRAHGGLIINRLTDIPYDFYSLVPTRLQPLYRGMLRSRQWEAGYVPGVHEKLLSSKIVPSVTKIITDKTVGGGYSYDGDSDAISKVIKWDKDVDFKTTVERLFYGSTLLGFSFIKNDIIDGVVSPRVVDADQIFYEEMNGDIIDAKTVVTYTTGNDPNSQGMVKYLMEHRYYDKEGNKKLRHFFTTSNSQFNQNSNRLVGYTDGDKINPGMLSDFGIDVKVGQNFLEILKDKHGIFLKPIDLNLKNGLGVFKIKDTIENPTYIKQNIGQGIAEQVGEDNLIKYELAHSLQSHELNIAPQIVVVPQGFDNGNFKSLNNPSGALGQNRPMDKTYFVRIPFGGDEDGNSEPKAIEFNIRSADILNMKNNILKDIALSVQLTPDDLGASVEKAVYESDSSKNKKDVTTSMINRKRRLAMHALRSVIDEVLHWENISDRVDLVWSLASDDDIEEKSNIAIMLVKNFLMSTKEALKMLYPNKTPSEREILLKEIEEDRENIIRTYYGGDNRNNTEKEKFDKDESKNRSTDPD